MQTIFGQFYVSLASLLANLNPKNLAQQTVLQKHNISALSYLY